MNYKTITGFSLQTLDVCESLLGGYNQASTTPLHSSLVLLLVVESLVVPGVSLPRRRSQDPVSSSHRHRAHRMACASATSRLSHSIHVIYLQRVSSHTPGLIGYFPRCPIDFLPPGVQLINALAYWTQMADMLLQQLTLTLQTLIFHYK